MTLNCSEIEFLLIGQKEQHSKIQNSSLNPTHYDSFIHSFIEGSKVTGLTMSYI